VSDIVAEKVERGKYKYVEFFLPQAHSPT